MKRDNNQNSKQNVSIAQIERDCDWMKKEIVDVKNQVYNHLPAQIRLLKGKLQSIKDRILFGFIIGITSLIVCQILLKFFV